MLTTIEGLEPEPGASPLASAALRFLVRQSDQADRPGPAATRPFGLNGATPVDPPVRREFCYCPEKQVAVDEHGLPLIETMGKDWRTKSSTDGDEGPEENWGWEEA
ncbi:putative ATP-grasp-modified RiPP [Amycolatopsis jejuensis]|uniref:putative ATP-grasp-modified RiPP n=1 Tax=Amycolatopsis jejuensis TaxID=330084 RepID=UPI0005240263|nr:putative ATP-grasp-modified RiPP [Amycolatopsis jejuensis]